ncbi:hypothetical protein KUCAC02_029955, partial [Chaenocephalus aceratus]
MESVVNLNNQFQSLRAQVEGMQEGIEPQFLQMASNFEECRKKWQRSGDELVSTKEVLAKTETERGALEVKLKHARNQVDERQLQLIRELLISENNGNSVHLSEEQRSALAFLSSHSQAAQAAKANLNSSRDISYDPNRRLSGLGFLCDEDCETEEAPEKRRSSRKLLEVPPQALKKPRSSGRTPERHGETQPLLTNQRTASEAPSTAVSDYTAKHRTPELTTEEERSTSSSEKTPHSGQHSDQELREHPGWTLLQPAPRRSQRWLSTAFKEIEHRAYTRLASYRISGQERHVKELKEKLIRGKTLPPLHKVSSKDFLRNLPEPLLTFHLNKVFMEAAEIQDDGNSLAMLFQAIGELPQPNRDTLACLMIHLQKVSQCVDTKMDVNNLARVFGPTLVVSILGPLTTPEHQMMAKTPSSSSLSQRMKQTLSSTT